MKAFETTLTERGITTVPKALREALGALGGGRVIWRLTAEGTLEATLKHAYESKGQLATRLAGKSLTP